MAISPLTISKGLSSSDQAAVARAYTAGGGSSSNISYSSAPAPAPAPSSGGLLSNPADLAAASARAFSSVVPNASASTQPIPASSIGTVQPFNMPRQPQPVNPYSMITVNNNGFVNPDMGTTVDGKGLLVYKPKEEVVSEKTLEQERLDNMLSSIGAIPKKDSVMKSAEIMNQNALIEQQRKEMQNTINQLNGITNQQTQVAATEQNDLLQVRGIGSREGVTEAVYGGQKSTINREAAIQQFGLAMRALPVQATLAAQQGNLALAQEHLNTLFKMKTEEVNNQYDYKMAVFGSVKEYVTKEQDIKLKALEKKTDREYAENKDFLDFQAKALSVAVPQKPPASVVNAMSAATTKAGVIAAAGQYGADILERRVKEKQLENIQSEIDKRNRENKPVFLDVEGKIVVDRTEAQKVSKELVNNDAYKAIQKSKDSLFYLKNFEDALTMYGSTSEVFDPIKNSELKAKYNAATLQLKEFFNLGVLNGPDLPLIQGVLPNPSDTSNFRKTIQLGTYQPGTAAKAGLASMKKMVETTLDDRYKSIRTQYSAYSPQSVAGLADANRIYIEQKSILNPNIQKLVDENPDLSDEEIITIMGL